MAISSSNANNMPSLAARKGDRNHRNADPPAGAVWGEVTWRWPLAGWGR